MTEADVYFHNFLSEGCALYQQQRLREALRRLVLECKAATDAKDDKLARRLLREADRVRAKLERLS